MTSRTLPSILGTKLSGHHPATVAAAIVVSGAVVLTAIVVLLGLSLMNGLLSGPLGRWDEGVNDWFLAHRTSMLDGWAHLGSLIGMTGSVVAVLFVVVLILLIARRWRDAAFLVLALGTEVTVFLITTLVVNRPRPTVPQLEPAPPTSSFPSGHTAAAIALWVGLAIVLAPHVRNTAATIILWVVAVSIPVYVALARVYAGMHHTTDVLASLIVGFGALAVASLAVRTAAVVHDRRALHDRRVDPSDRPLQNAEVST